MQKALCNRSNWSCHLFKRHLFGDLDLVVANLMFLLETSTFKNFKVLVDFSDIKVKGSKILKYVERMYWTTVKDGNLY